MKKSQDVFGLMDIITLEENFDKSKYGRTAVAIGKFDGIHRGHLKLFKRLLEYKKQGFTTVVFTFDRSIAAFFKKEQPMLLTTAKEQQDVLSQLLIDVLFIYPVNEQSVMISPEAFVREILSDKLGAGAVIAGADCSFGARGEGNIELLKALEKELSFETIVVDKEIDEQSGLEISSTYIRQELLAGEIEHVADMLGRGYSFVGRVRHGRKLGRQMSMPTVNLVPSDDKLLPPYGVYKSMVYVGSDEYRGLTNIGRKPTVNDTPAVTVETYIYDFDDDLYGENIRVELLSFVRPEMKFNSVDELKARMRMDIDCAWN